MSMAGAGKRLLTDETGVRIAEALEEIPEVLGATDRELRPEGLVTTGIRLTSSVSGITHGGYAKIGKLVILNIRVALTSTGKAAGSRTYLSGLPMPLTQDGFTVIVNTNQHGLVMYMNADGQIMKNSSAAAISTDNIILNAAYLTIDE